MSNPETACTSLIGNYTGTIALIDVRGANCTLAVRATNAQARGAVGVLFITEADNVFVEEVVISNVPTILTPFVWGFTNRVRTRKGFSNWAEGGAERGGTGMHHLDAPPHTPILNTRFRGNGSGKESRTQAKPKRHEPESMFMVDNIDRV